MEQLLSIRNVPLKLDVKVEPGKFEVEEPKANSTSAEGNNANKALETLNQDSITLNNLSGDNTQPDGSGVVANTNEASTIDNNTIENEMKFVPRKVECKIKEFPHVEIEYLGKPIYVPPSSDPDRKREYPPTKEKDSEDIKTELDLLV